MTHALRASLLSLPLFILLGPAARAQPEQAEAPPPAGLEEPAPEPAPAPPAEEPAAPETDPAASDEPTTDEAAPAEAGPAEAGPAEAAPAEPAAQAEPTDAAVSAEAPWLDEAPADVADAPDKPSAVPRPEGVETDAEKAWELCREQVRAGRATEARACLEDVRARFPDTAAAAKAEAALDLLPAVGAEEAGWAPMLPAFLKPGRLEMAFASGVLGVWSGVTAGVLTGFNADQMNLRVEPWMLVLGTGAAGVTLGLAGAAGGYALADLVDIDQGNAWAFAAGATWGTSYAIAALPAIYESVKMPWYLNDEIIGLTPLFSAGLGAATGLGLSLVLDPEISEVSMMNTGGWVGGAWGFMLGLNIALWTDTFNQRPITTMAASYALGNTAGLLAGVAASQLLDLTWGETLFGDFGALLGGMAFGSVALAFLISPAAEPTFAALGFKGTRTERIYATVATSSIGVGMATGIGLTTAGLFAWHAVMKRPFLKLDLPFQMGMGPPVIVLDQNQQPAVGLPSLTFTF